MKGKRLVYFTTGVLNVVNFLHEGKMFGFYFTLCAECGKPFTWRENVWFTLSRGYDDWINPFSWSENHWFTNGCSEVIKAFLTEVDCFSATLWKYIFSLFTLFVCFFHSLSVAWNLVKVHAQDDDFAQSTEWP